MPFPPHLPPPSSSIELHRRWGRLKIILIATAFGLLAGVSGASMALGWIWPGYGEGDTWATSRSLLAAGHGGMEEPIRFELAERVAAVYSALSAGAPKVSYLDHRNKIGDALIVSSDGWLAMAAPSGISVNLKEWRALTRSGRVYILAQAVFDRYSGLLYLKMALPAHSSAGGSAEQFKIVSFNETSERPDDVYLLGEGQWTRALVVGERRYAAQKIHPESAPTALYALGVAFPRGALAVTGQGKIAGIVAADGGLLPSAAITRVLPAVLTSGKISYPTLGAEGWFSFESPLVVNGETAAGFFVSRAGKASQLERGDLITELNGEFINPDSLWYNKGREKVRVKVQRSGKIIELESTIFSL